MFSKIRKIVGTVVLVVFFLALVVVLFARVSGTTPSLFGFSMLRVETQSMEPELKVGNIILVKKVDPATLKKGDVITYYGQEPPVNGKLITHQISEEPRVENGKYYFITKGLANTLSDPEFDDSQLYGKVVYKVPLIGTLYDFFSSPFGLIAFVVVMLIAFSSELINLISIIRGQDEEFDKEVPASAADPVFIKGFEITVEQESSEILTDLEDEA